MHITKLAPQMIQLHYASLKLLHDEFFSAQVFGWLSSEELKRYKRFVSKQQADQFLLARALLRGQLSKLVPNVMPDEWVFVVDDYGKPRLADEFSYLNIRFNLSHSEDLVVLVLGREVDGRLNLGVDVECIYRPVFSMALAKRFYSESEWVDLLELTKQQQVKRIAQLWTLKESYLKAGGLGIRVPLDKLEFCFVAEDDLGIRVSPSWIQSLPVAERSLISLFNLTFLGSEYSLALTIEADKNIDTSALEINEWIGLNGRLSDLRCELLRKTAG